MYQKLGNLFHMIILLVLNRSDEYTQKVQITIVNEIQLNILHY